MRLLHTADWHVGCEIGHRPRTEEFAEVLDEVVGIAVQERVDAVLVAGDLYEHRLPSPETHGLVFDTLLRLRGQGIPVVAIAGNHDSPALLSVLGKVLAPLGTSLVTRPVLPDSGGVVEVRSRDGSDAAIVACLPFAPPRYFIDARRMHDAAESVYLDYAEQVGGLIAELAAAFRSDRVNVLMAHLFTDGALLGGGERDLGVAIGMAYAVSPARLPGNASYAALGHAHLPQTVKSAPCPARYAGSLLQLDFGEQDEAKSVTLVEALPGRPAKVSEIALRSGWQLRDVRGRLDELVERAKPFGAAHLRVTVDTQGPVPGLAARVRELLPNAVEVHIAYPRADEAEAAPPVSALSPREQYIAYYRKAHEAEPEDALLAAFDEVLTVAREPKA